MSEDVFVFPASFAQQRLWFLDQFDPGSPFYNIPQAIRLTGALDVNALGDALREIVARHETLRTTFSMLDGQPVQLIHPELGLPLPVIDLTGLEQEQRYNEALRLVNQEARRPFNLERGPLLRATLLKLKPDEYIALLTMHHIISDGWSMAVLIGEISTLYDAFSHNRPSPLPDLPIQYADFTIWQRDYLKGEVLEEQLDYWRKQLGQGGGVLELPADHPRPAVITSRGATLSRTIPRQLTERLKALAQHERATLFMVLLAGFQTLLYRYTGQEDISVGSPIANRQRAEIESLIGVFINTLVLRTNLGGDPSFRELLSRVREVTLGAYAHQDTPFELIVDHLKIERDMSHSPLFQVMFILQNAPVRAQQLTNLQLESLDVHSGTSTFDITLSMAEMEAGLDASVEYNTDLFERATIQRMLEHFENILESAVSNPDLRLSELRLLSSAERELLLTGWNQTDNDFLANPGLPEAWQGLDRRQWTIPQLFQAQAALTPEAEAVVVPDTEWQPGGRLTYRQLAEQAGRLAQQLQHLGVGPGVVVGLCMDRSLELVVGWLGILLAGGAYLPLDPLYPTERLAFILADSQVRHVVTLERVKDALPAFTGIIISLDNEQSYSEKSTEQVPAPGMLLPEKLTPDDLVYLTYTSGSTGQSKGVLVEQRSLVNQYLAWEDAYRLRELHSHLQMANFTFDVFSGDLVRALLSGGKLVLCPREWLLTPDQLYKLLLDESIDCAEFVPAVLRNLVQYLESTPSQRRLDFMRLLICGSDSWYVGEYRRFLAYCGAHTRLVNSFGLTETTIDSTYFEDPLEELAQKLKLQDDQVVPIGKAFANTRLYILDKNLQPVPIGIPGELLIGGPGLARGYLNRPELNNEKFIPDLFTHKTPGRLYRSGDLARYLVDGNIEFLGRVDDQIKLRGFRIEPGEIEAVLSSHPGVHQAAVLPIEVALNDKRLAAFIAPLEPGEPPAASELRRHVQERLPDYMTPAAFIFLEKLPLNASGKIDRRALAAIQEIDWGQRQSSVEYEAPTNPLEEKLSEVWSRLLGVPKVGINDNFFELGGHSLMATQLLSQIRQVFQVELPLRKIFEQPTVAGLAQQITLLSAGQARPQIPPLVPVPRDLVTGLPLTPPPLSFAQQRLWFLDQLEPDSPFYNLPEAVRLSGQLNVSALERALNEVINRHESLRTSFQVHPQHGQAVQCIAAPNTVQLQIVHADLRALGCDLDEPAAYALRLQAAQELAQGEAQTPFKLTETPLLRARLLQIADEEFFFLLTMHHIVGDNWSSNVLVQEVAILYDAFDQSRPTEQLAGQEFTQGLSPLPPLTLQYADFATWQRNWLQGETLANELGYWKTKLAGLPPLLELPTDRPRPAIQSFSGAYKTFQLTNTLTRQINDLCQHANVTSFMCLLAAFQTLLYRYSGQTDISVGTPIANRNQRGIENLIGFFVNTLVMRASFEALPGEELTFLSLLTQVRETALEAYAHQDVPFEMVVDALQPQRNLSHSPLFQVMFTLQSGGTRLSMGGARMSTARALSSGLVMSPYEAHSGTAKFDLTLFMTDDDGRLGGALEYNTDLFDTATMERFITHFQTLLEGIVADPQQPVARLPLLTAQERRRMVVEWNQTAAPLPDVHGAHQLFEAQVLKTPDAVALTYGSQPEINLTYAELNQKANLLAHYLRVLGVVPDTLVAISMERSPELVVSLLGVLKAGGAYVPIDPAYPSHRIAFMLEDSQATLLLTQARLVERLAGNPTVASPGASLRIIYVDRDWASIAEAAIEQPSFYTNLANTVSPGNLAYVIYTSGSTGRPKGAMIQHGGLINYLTWCQRAYPLLDGQGSPVHSSISFDLTITSLFSPLICGKRAYLLPEGLAAGEVAPVEALGITLRTATMDQLSPFSLVKITPAHLQVLSGQLSTQQAAGATRAFIIGGENLLDEHIAYWQRHAPATALVNEYGPTETVVGCCVYWVPPDRQPGGVLPIGKPIINTQLYVLDNHLQPAPVGVRGELYIGGAGVARGYLNRPELTVERFIDNPFIGEDPQLLPGARIYRTGDLARYLPDGNLECLGRLDFQVKIRGFRVELGEIEAVLAQHPAVKEAVAWVRVDNSLQRLVAYVVLDGTTRQVGRALNHLAGELRDYLKDRLPEYMTPSAFVVLDQIPLTANGKVDHAALPAPEMELFDRESGYIAPRSPQEELVAGLWSDILGVERIGAFDNFFSMGGHSLLATQVISRLRDVFQVELPLRALFEYPNLAELTAQIEVARQQASGLLIPPIEKLPRDLETGLPVGPVPLSYAQQRLWVLDQLLPNSPLYNIPTVVEVAGELDLAGLEYGIEKVIKRHEALRTVFTSVAGKPVQVVLPGIRIPLQMHDLRGLAEADRLAQARQLALDDALTPFNLEKGPLMRMGVAWLAEKHYQIFLNTHHIVSDGWSLPIFIRELLVFYHEYVSRKAASKGEKPEGTPDLLPALPVQYPDYAAWQRQWLAGESLDEQIAYWEKQLANLNPVLELPTDRPRPHVQTHHGEQVTFLIPARQANGLKSLAKDEGATLFMTLLALFQVLLYRYTGQEDIPVGTPIANRTRTEIEGLVGFFVNTLVLRGDLSGEPGFREALRRTREAALGAYAHQDVPFELVVDKLQLSRELSYNPVFQVMFILQNAPGKISGPGSNIQVTPVELHEGIARFDLTLMMVENSTYETGALESISGSLEYNTDLYDRSTIERMIGHLLTLVDDILTAPDLPVSRLKLLTEPEARLLLEAWPGARQTLPAECVIDLFEQQVAKSPQSISTVFTIPGDDREPVYQELSYAELNQQANALAHFLLQRGLKSEEIVGICIERSVGMVVGLLGILKAGGAYLPLDPEYPKERLRFMLEDAGVKVLLTQASLLDRLPENLQSSGCEVVCLDQDWELIAPRQQGWMNNPGIQIMPGQLAYVIYTSGSTGRPKGVLLEHAGLANLVQQQIKGFGLSAHSRVLQFASFSFDASVSEIFMALLSGGRLVLTNPETLNSVNDLLRVIVEQAITTITLPPSLLRVLDPGVAGQALDSLSTLISAGEACSLDIARRWAINRHMFNAYGPTESTVGPTYYPVNVIEGEEGWQVSGIPHGVSTVPIGRTIPNMYAYLLDRFGQPAPIGVPGEIYLAGIGIARGYLNRPELTAEKFIANTIAPQAGDRLYRTGDLARYLPDGNLEYLGRVDQQVKVRGYRIELGEIENTVAGYPGIRTAVVVAREDTPGSKRLVAYLVPENDLDVSGFIIDQLKEFLHDRLPEYMVPAIFIWLQHIPLTINGKIDYKALPTPDPIGGQLTTAYLAPRNELEAQLVDIWAEVLQFIPDENHPAIGVHDNFFELGGDSILGIQMISRATQAGFGITARQLFEHPTIAGLAEAIKTAVELPAVDAMKAESSGDEILSSMDQADFGWSDSDIDDILGAIGLPENGIHPDQEPQE